MVEEKQETKIVALVVTYNRLELLKKVVGALRQCTPKPDILVVDNGSTDGTSQWLDSQEGLAVIHQANVGGSGGFHTGMREACRMNADWIWCMDDDVYPHPDCLEKLLACATSPDTGLLVPRRLLGGKIYTSEFREYDLTNPFTSKSRGKLSGHPVTAPTEIKGSTFEGPLIRREVVDDIGLPNKDFFILWDDTDFCFRAVRKGYKMFYVPDAIMEKHKFFSEDSWSSRQSKKKWKRLYQIRNLTYFNHRYGRNVAVKYLRGLFSVMEYILIAVVTCPFASGYQWSDIRRFWHAYQDGVHECLGIIK